jgi:hypothetical protein
MFRPSIDPTSALILNEKKEFYMGRQHYPHEQDGTYHFIITALGQYWLCDVEMYSFLVGYANEPLM